MSSALYSKVICIGWHKTGTTSIGDALLELDYSVLGARIDLAKSLLDGDTQTAIETANGFDALQDMPWAVLYRELDNAFPNSKFILTTRDEQIWIKSALRHFGSKYSAMREWVYGVGAPQNNEELYLERYRRHYSEVMEYFKGRPNDLLVLDLSEGNGWESICSFLNKKIPKKPFPHSNRGFDSGTIRSKLRRRLQKTTPMFLRRLRIRFLRIVGIQDPRYRFNNRTQNEEVRKKSRI